MLSYEKRLKTFAKWPKHLPTKPQKIAEAGFTYIRPADKKYLVRCRECKFDLYFEDSPNVVDPWSFHAWRYPPCKFVVAEKGEEFVTRYQREESRQRKDWTGSFSIPEMQEFCETAGLDLDYDELFKDCETYQDRVDKLIKCLKNPWLYYGDEELTNYYLATFEERKRESLVLKLAVTGKPTLEKCQKTKLRLERLQRFLQRRKDREESEQGRQESEQGGPESAQGGQESAQGGQESAQGGQESEQGGQEGEQGGQEREQGGQESEQGGQENEQGGQKNAQGGQESEQGGQEKRLSYAERLRTFDKWPADHPIKPEAFAAAGFVAAGEVDLVICTRCDLRLYDWKAEEDPWAVHASKYPPCEFVREEKGTAFINRHQVKGWDISVVKYYCKVAGVQYDYKMLVKDCVTYQDRVNRFIALLNDAGIEGIPNVQKCRALKAKKKREEKEKKQREQEADHSEQERAQRGPEEDHSGQEREQRGLEGEHTGQERAQHGPEGDHSGQQRAQRGPEENQSGEERDQSRQESEPSRQGAGATPRRPQAPRRRIIKKKRSKCWGKIGGAKKSQGKKGRPDPETPEPRDSEQCNAKTDQANPVQNIFVLGADGYREAVRDSLVTIMNSTGLKRATDQIHTVPDKKAKLSCDKCDKSYTRRENLKKHIAAQHEYPKTSFNCPQCSKSYVTASFLLNHIKTQHERNDKICLTCGEIFRTVTNCKNHIKTCGIDATSVTDGDEGLAQGNVNLGGKDKAASAKPPQNSQETSSSSSRSPCKLCLEEPVDIAKHYLDHHNIRDPSSMLVTDRTFLIPTGENQHCDSVWFSIQFAKAMERYTDTVCRLCDRDLRHQLKSLGLDDLEVHYIGDHKVNRKFLSATKRLIRKDGV